MRTSASPTIIAKSSEFAEDAFQPCLEAQTFECFVCNQIFLSPELLKLQAVCDHNLKICPLRLIDFEEEDTFVQFLKSMEVGKEYIEQRMKHYPEEWKYVGERIKFRKLAQMKLEMTSKQIEENMEKNDFMNFQYCGWSYEVWFKSKYL